MMFSRKSYSIPLLIIFSILFIPFVLSSASFSSYSSGFQTSQPNLQNYYGSSASNYWPILNRLQNDECSSLSTDFIVYIPVGGCDPNVVRSDLLAEQNVPVFCKLSAIRVNPLIDVSTISSISFSGNLPEGVAGVSYHPADSAINNYKTLVSDAVEKDIGSVVITLKRRPEENNTEYSVRDMIGGVLTANIRFNSKMAYGVGNADFYLDQITDNDWSKTFTDYSFWANKGYLRAEVIEEDSAKINVYLNEDKIYSSFYLREGETSQTIYYPGYYCTVGFKVRLNSISDKSDMALISVNDDNYWVKQGTKIGDTGCSVRNLEIFADGSGEVRIYCPGNNNIDLSIKSTGVTLNNSTENKSGMVAGDYIINEGKRWYLGYYKRAGSSSFGDFVVLLNLTTNPSKEELLRLNLIGESSNNKNSLEAELKKVTNLRGEKIYDNKYEIVNLGEKGNLSNIYFVGYPSLQDISSGELNEPFLSNFSEGTNVVKELVDVYPYEDKGNGEFWGEEALFEQIKVAQLMKNNSILDELTEQFISLYPNSKLYKEVLEIQRNLGTKNFENSIKAAFINNNFYEFSVNKFVGGSDYDKKTTLEFNGVEKTGIRMNRVYNSAGREWSSDDGAQVRITNIDKDSVSVQYYADGKTYSSKVTKGASEVLARGTDYSLEIKVKDCFVETVAHVSIIPEINNKQTQANFSFGFPIEQRTIPLTPEAAVKGAEDVNKTLESLRKTSENLKETLTIWNGVCTAYSGVIMGMNFLSGLSGEATARTIVNNYYKEYCKQNHQDESLIKCYEEEKVEEVVGEVTKAIRAVNQDIGTLSKEFGDKDFFGRIEINDIEGLIEEIKNNFSKFNSMSVSIEGIKVNFSDLTTKEQVRAALLHYRLRCNETSNSKACNVSQKNLEIELGAARIAQLKKELVSKYGVSVDEYVVWLDRGEAVYVSILDGEGKDIGEISFSKGDYFKVVEYNSRVYLLNISKEQGQLNLSEVYQWNTSNKFEVSTNSLRLFSKILLRERNIGDCKHYYKNPEVRYYNSGYAKDRPSVVPIDIQEGWYAYVPSTKSQGYDESGNVNFFWICNVGPNGVMNLMSQDDAAFCHGYETSNPVFFEGRICDKSVSQQRDLYNKAIRYIQMALNSKDGIILDGNQKVSVGDKVSGSADLDCLDYMSAEQCKRLYNACDPVVCPSSRCNNGGYVVEDVASSGIVGGLFLCWHNGIYSGGDVVVPICLTAVYSGLENAIAMLEQYQSCLLRRAETGEYVGACDRIYSLYLCNLLWENAPLLTDNFLPGLFDLRKSSGGGGGEYLTGEDSVKKTQETLGFFTDYYAKNVFDSFKIDQNLEYPTSICSIDDFLVSGNVSGDFASLARSFLEPETSSQAYAHFTESGYTTRTNPPTSHYKVYYQIYAGNKYTQTSYMVYLKNPSESYSLTLPQQVILKSENLRPGESASETLDFTAPSGYKELCISMNGKEYCGFGSTGSSFLGDLASDYYIKNQMDKEIKTTTQCKSTTLGVKDISSVGVTRICSSSSPSIGGLTAGSKVYCNTDRDCNSYYKCETEVEGSEIKVCKNYTLGLQVSDSNWVDVGYCDNPSIRCWVDKQSVDNALKVMNLSEISSLIGSAESLEKLETLYKSVSEELDNYKKEIDSLTIQNLEVQDIKVLIEKLRNISGYEPKDGVGKGENEHKARALAYESSLYRMMIKSQLMDGALVWIEVPPVESPSDNQEGDGDLHQGGDGGDASTSGESESGDNGEEAEEEEESGSTYTVKSGDTLTSIANLYGMSLKKLKDLNPGIEDYSKIYPGDKIIIAP